MLKNDDDERLFLFFPCLALTGRKLRLYLPDISSSAPVQPPEEDSVFVDPEDPGPPSAADGKETSEPQEAAVPVAGAAAGGKVEQERWRFSASELISKLQLSQRRNNFTAKIGKSLSTKITLREKGSSTSQEGGYTAAPLSVLYIIIIQDL